MIKLYNTLSRKKEPLKPVKEGKIGIYACGPTVYDYFHIGNARVFITFDVLRRYLAYRGYDVTFVQNYTDIDDKMINKAAELKITVDEVAGRFISAYEEDTAALGILPADYHPRATRHIPQIIALIQRLIDKKMAYEVEGDVYFHVEAFLVMASFPDRTWKRLCPVPGWKSRKEKSTPWILPSGRRKSQANLPGRAPGAEEGLDGILSVQPCPCITWGDSGYSWWRSGPYFPSP